MKLSEAIAALERGEEVEFDHGDGVWRPITEESNLSMVGAKLFKFRLKPKPITLWLNFYPEGMYAHVSKEIAERALGPGASRIAVPFREVVPLTEGERSRFVRIRDAYAFKLHLDILFLLDLLKKQGVE